MAICNVVALRKVVSQHESAPLKDVVKAISIKLRLADQNDNEARKHREEAGGMLVALRQRVETDNLDWWKFAKDHFDRERRELEQLMKHVPARDAVKAAIEAKPELEHKSDREIAREVGVADRTVNRVRRMMATATNVAVEKRVGKDGKARKMPAKNMAAQMQQATATYAPKPRKLPKLPKIDKDVIKQAGTFHIELMKYTAEFCASVKAWHAANEIDEESHDCVVKALEMASMNLQLTAQDIDGRGE